MTNPQMICPSLLKDAHGLEGKKVTAFNACGTGPYKLVRFNPAEELLVERNPDYRVPGLPKFKALRWVPVVENSTRAAMLQTGEAQFIQMAPVEQIPVLKANPNLAVLMPTCASCCWTNCIVFTAVVLLKADQSVVLKPFG